MFGAGKVNYSLPYYHLASYSLSSTMRNIIAWNVRGPLGPRRVRVIFSIFKSVNCVLTRK